MPVNMFYLKQSKTKQNKRTRSKDLRGLKNIKSSILNRESWQKLNASKFLSCVLEQWRALMNGIFWLKVEKERSIDWKGFESDRWHAVKPP